MGSNNNFYTTENLDFSTMLLSRTYIYNVWIRADTLYRGSSASSNSMIGGFLSSGCSGAKLVNCHISGKLGR